MLHGRKLEVAWLFFCSVYVSTRSVIFAILISKCLHQCLLSIFGQLGRNLWKLGTNETCLVKQYKRLRKASLFCNSCLEKKLNINLRCIFLLICFFSWVDPDEFTWMPNFFVLMVLMFVWLIYVFFFSSFFGRERGCLFCFVLKHMVTKVLDDVLALLGWSQLKFYHWNQWTSESGQNRGSTYLTFTCPCLSTSGSCACFDCYNQDILFKCLNILSKLSVQIWKYQR